MSAEFKVDLRALVDLLARHVYSSPRVFVRELLQNGVDAVTARRLADPSAPRGPVRLLPADAGGDGALVVTDPGIGLTASEVQQLLATIGGSSKRDVLDLPREEFLGRFGIGLLSCLVIADRFEVLTRSAGGGAPVRFVGYDDGTYEVAMSPSTAGWPDPVAVGPGTAVRLRPRAGQQEWVTASMVERLARMYGAALDLPILVQRPDGSTVDITDYQPPWRGAVTGEGQGREAAQAAWCERQFGCSPLAVVPLRAPSSGAEGVAFVLPDEAPGTSHPGHRVYLRGMLLAEDTRHVLPDWALFVRCVLDAGHLSPTASREALVDDDALADTRQELGACLRDWLLTQASADPDLLADILAIHGRAVKALAVHDDDALRTFAPWLTLETTEGELRLSDIVERATPAVRYARTLDRFRQLAPIAAAQGLLVVNAGYSYDRDLLHRLGVLREGTVAEELQDGDAVAVLDPVAADRRADAERFVAAASEALRESDCDVEVRRFQPDVVPGLYLFDAEAAGRRRLRDTARLSDDAWAGILADLDDGGSDRPRLVFNDAHPVVGRLVDRAGASGAGTGPEDEAALIRALYVQILLLGHRPLKPADLDLLNHALGRLIDVSM